MSEPGQCISCLQKSMQSWIGTKQISLLKCLLFFNTYKRCLQRAWSVVLSKSVIHCGPLSGFPYCNLITLPPSIEVIPYHPLRDTLSCCIGLSHENQHQPLFVIITSRMFIKVLKKSKIFVNCNSLQRLHNTYTT